MQTTTSAAEACREAYEDTIRAERHYARAVAEAFPVGTRVEFERGRGMWRGVVTAVGNTRLTVQLDSGKEVNVEAWWLWKDYAEIDYSVGHDGQTERGACGPGRN